jgi:DUF4097 and DUF4098 domain-containing protein YvlB
MALGTVLLTASALGLGGCHTSNVSSTKRNSYTVTEPVASLKVDNPIGATRVEGTDVTTVSVTEQLSYAGNPPQTSHSISDGQLALTYACSSRVSNSHVCSVDYVIKVPRGVAVQIGGNVGDTTLTGLAGQLTATSNAGDINGTGLAGGAVSARASAGAITLRFTAPPTTVNAQARVGSVEVQLPGGTTYAVDAGSRVGDVEVTVQRDPGSTHHISAHSEVGAVTVTNG